MADLKETKKLSQARQQLTFEYHDFLEQYACGPSYSEEQINNMVDFFFYKLADIESRMKKK